MTDVIRKYSPEEAAARRERFIEAAIAPVVASVLSRYAQLNSAVLMVSQFWADEADDAVHHEIRFSLSSSPDIPAFLLETQKNDEHDSTEQPYTDDLHNKWAASSAFMEGPTAALAALGNVEWRRISDFQDEYEPEIWKVWDSNGEAISLFAAFCKEGTHQDAPIREAFMPYCIFRRAPAGHSVEVEVVGQKLRPWLEGVRPQSDEPRGISGS